MSRPSTSGGLEELEEEEKEGGPGSSEVQGEKKGSSSSLKAMVRKNTLTLTCRVPPTHSSYQQNGKPPVTNGRVNQHVNGDNADDDSGDDAAGLRDELEKEKTRSQVLERQLASLRKDLIQKSKSVEATISVRQEELLKEKARSQELEKTVQELRSELSRKSTSLIEDTAAQGKLQELEEQLSAQRKEAVDLRKSLEGEKDDRGNERADADQRLAKVQEEKKQLDTQYKTLLGRVAHIKTTLGDKLKSDAVSIFGFIGLQLIRSKN